MFYFEGVILKIHFLSNQFWNLFFEGAIYILSGSNFENVFVEEQFWNSILKKLKEIKNKIKKN